MRIVVARGQASSRTPFILSEVMTDVARGKVPLRLPCLCTLCEFKQPRSGPVFISLKLPPSPKRTGSAEDNGICDGRVEARQGVPRGGGGAGISSADLRKCAARRRRHDGCGARGAPRRASRPLERASPRALRDGGAAGTGPRRPRGATRRGRSTAGSGPSRAGSGPTFFSRARRGRRRHWVVDVRRRRADRGPFLRLASHGASWPRPQGRGVRTEPAALGVSTGEARPRGFGLSPRRRRPRSRARNGVRRRRSATPSAPGVTWTRKTTFSAPRRARGSGSRVSIDFDRGHDARARAARRRRRTSVDLIFYTWGPPRRVRRRKPRPL